MSDMDKTERMLKHAGISYERNGFQITAFTNSGVRFYYDSSGDLEDLECGNFSKPRAA